MIKQQLDGSKVNHFFSRLIGLLVISCESSEAIEPSKCPLYNPSERFRQKALSPIWGVAYFQFNLEVSLNGIDNLTPVTSIGKNLLDGKPNIRCSLDKFCYKARIMDLCGINSPSEYKSVSVYNDATFDSLYFLVAIEAIITHAIAPLDALCVKYPNRWRLKLFAFLSYSHCCFLYEMFNSTIIPPFTEVFIHRLPFGEILWEHSPLTPADQKVEYGFKYGLKRIFTMSAIIFKEYFVYIRPLTLGQMCLIEEVYMHIKSLFSSNNTLVEGFMCS